MKDLIKAAMKDLKEISGRGKPNPLATYQRMSKDDLAAVHQRLGDQGMRKYISYIHQLEKGGK